MLGTTSPWRESGQGLKTEARRSPTSLAAKNTTRAPICGYDTTTSASSGSRELISTKHFKTVPHYLIFYFTESDR